MPAESRTENRTEAPLEVASVSIAPLAGAGIARRSSVVRTPHFWLSAEDELKLAESKHGRNSLQARYVRFLGTNKVQMILIGLLVVDVIVVIFELFIDLEYPACWIITRDAISCFNASDADDEHTTTEQHHRMLAAGSSSGEAHHHCADGLVDMPSWPAGCDEHKWATAHTAHEVLFAVSVLILSIFAVELSLLIAALGSSFFRQPFYLLDAFVVSMSLVLELMLRRLADQIHELAGFLALARAWRFLRIGHGLATSVHEVDHGEIHALEHEVEKLRAELARATS